jgi:hypothetical protein
VKEALEAKPELVTEIARAVRDKESGEISRAAAPGGDPPNTGR